MSRAGRFEHKAAAGSQQEPPLLVSSLWTPRGLQGPPMPARWSNCGASLALAQAWMAGCGKLMAFLIFASVEEPGGSQRLSRLVTGCEGDRNREADL